jgi:hypothetical protein
MEDIVKKLALAIVAAFAISCAPIAAQPVFASPGILSGN